MNFAQEVRKEKRRVSSLNRVDDGPIKIKKIDRSKNIQLTY